MFRVHQLRYRLAALTFLVSVALLVAG